jgi:hypothetical protein
MEIASRTNTCSHPNKKRKNVPHFAQAFCDFRENVFDFLKNIWPRIKFSRKRNFLKVSLLNIFVRTGIYNTGIVQKYNLSGIYLY